MLKTKQYKAEGKKIIYGILPAVVTPYTAFKRAGGDNVHVSFPDLVLIQTLNGFFHKGGPLISKAEEMASTTAAATARSQDPPRSPSPPTSSRRRTSFWSWGFNCDEGPEDRRAHPVPRGRLLDYVISRIPHDTYFGEADDEEAAHPLP